MSLTKEQADFLRWARVGHLATVAPEGTPHVVPVCPVLDGEEVVVMLEGGSAKLRNALGEAGVALVVDEYREDWDALAGLLVRGRVRVLEDEARMRGRDLLYEKFTQYPTFAPLEDGDAIIAISIDRVASWGL